MSNSSQKSGPSSAGGGLLNLLAMLLLILSCLCLGSVGAIFAAPGLVPAFLQVPTEPALILIFTASPASPISADTTSLVPTFPPTWTPQFTPTETPTRPPTSTPTITQTPSNTPSITVTPSKTRTPTATVTPSKTFTLTPTGPTPTRTRTLAPFNYVLQNGAPSYSANWTNTAGCNWLGIAGQVFDLNGRSVQGLYVHLEGGGLSMDAPTGAKTMYGPGGYELYLADHVFNSTNTFRIQLRDGAGNPLSDWYFIPTFEDCSKNLILANFQQDH